jgi:hypothetical protein
MVPASNSVYQQWSYSPGNDNFSLVLRQEVTSGNVRYVFDQTNVGTAYPSVLAFNQGNVGIGTYDPDYKLDVNNTTNELIARFYRSSSATSITHLVSTGRPQTKYSYDGQTDWYVGNNVGTFGIAKGYLASTTPALNITTTENVGLSFVSPDVKLVLEETPATIAGGNAINGSTMKGIKIRTNLNGDESVGLWFGTNGSHWSGISGQRKNAATTWGTTLSFYTHEDTAQDLTYSRERMLITSAGELQVTGNGVIRNEHSSANFSTWEQTASFARLSTRYAQPLYFATDASTKMTILSGGNVGIGVTSPTLYKLDVAGNVGIGFSTGNKIVINSQSGFQNSTLESHIISANGLGGFGSGDLLIQPRCSNVGANSIIFGTSNNTNTAAERMRVLANGNVGINVTGPNCKFQVVSTSTTEPTVRFTSTGYTYISYADPYHGLILRGVPSAYNTYGVTAGDQMSFLEYGGDFRFYQKNGLGTLENQGQLLLGTWTVKGDVIAYGSPSDKRLKENIKPIESALDKVSKLQGVTFDWKESDSILDIKEDIGFIAQDVQKVVPELVRENKDGMLSMRHQGIAPILLEAIKELKAEIDLLKSKPCTCNKCNCNI